MQLWFFKHLKAKVVWTIAKMQSGKPGLDNEGRDVVDLDPDGLADAGGNKNLGAGGRIHSRTKVRTLKEQKC